MRRSLSVACIVALAACARSPAAKAPTPAAPAQTQPTASAITSGEQLVRAMYDQYQGKWYRSLTFVQTTTFNVPGSAEPQVQTWYEAITLPGRLRIDTDRTKQDGVLYRGDSLYRFQNGRLTASARTPNELLILGFDVYAVPPDRMAAHLRTLGFDLSKLSLTTWDGRAAYVVGDSAPPRARAFWVDKERLVFVRLVSFAGRDSSHVSDFRFNKYQPLEGGWVSPEVEQLYDGKRRFLEEYRDMRANVALDSALFDPAQWRTVKPW